MTSCLVHISTRPSATTSVRTWLCWSCRRMMWPAKQWGEHLTFKGSVVQTAEFRAPPCTRSWRHTACCGTQTERCCWPKTYCQQDQHFSVCSTPNTWHHDASAPLIYQNGEDTSWRHLHHRLQTLHFVLAHCCMCRNKAAGLFLSI